ERAFPDKKLFLSTNVTQNKLWIVADGFLTELFFNLLHNVMKVDKSELVKVDVEANEVEDKDFVKVQIMDYGPGVSDNEKQHIFSRYKDEFDGVRGSGIGLTLVQRILNRYGGQIWVEDRVRGDSSQGANFVVLLPRGEP
ncbi:MAG: sensor histidine kinase, partial [Candidatus Thorarchaeota archaeon]